MAPFFSQMAVCIGTPMDVALVRLQADSMKPEAERRNYKNVFDALATTAKSEGLGAHRCDGLKKEIASQPLEAEMWAS